MRWLSKIPDLIWNPKENSETIKTYYEMIRADYPGIKAFGDNAIEAKCIGPPTSLPLKLVRAQTHYQAAQCIILTIAITLNAFMSKHFGPDDLLATERYTFCADVIQLSERARHRRPLAAAHVPLCLITAWLASQDPVQQIQLELLMDDYEQDYNLIDLVRNSTQIEEEGKTGIIRKLPCFPMNILGGQIETGMGTGVKGGPEAYCAEYCNIL